VSSKIASAFEAGFGTVDGGLFPGVVGLGQGFEGSRVFGQLSLDDRNQ